MSISSIRPVLETYDTDGRMFRHPKAYRRRWSSYYGEDGGGFGMLAWSEDRAIGTDYEDLGFLYPVKLRKGLCLILFDGVIVDIDEKRSPEKDTLTITAVGWSAAFAHDTYNNVYRDNRGASWVGREDESFSFVPSKFESILQGQDVEIRPKNGVNYRGGEYAYVRYSMPFEGTIETVAFSSVVELPFDWPGHFALRDSEDVLWSSMVSTQGVHFLTPVAGARWLEARFTLREWGEYDAEGGPVFGKLVNVVVSSRVEEVLTAREVALDLVEVLEPHGISQDTSKIGPTYRELPRTVVFDTDMTPKEILQWCCKFGGLADTLLAWGIELNDSRRVYLETQDLQTLKYVVRRSVDLKASVRGSFENSAQKLYVVYTDLDDQVRRTDDIVDQDRIDAQGGLYRRVAYRLSGKMEEDTAEVIGTLRQAESSRPATSSDFTVSDRVYTITGKAIAIDEVQAGGMVIVDDFRSREAALATGDLRRQWGPFQLVGVEIDEDARSVRLIPAGDTRAFELFMTRVAEELGT